MLSITEFTPFPSLPKELRCLVWAQTLSPRIIPMIVESYAPDSPTSHRDLYIKFPVPTKVDTLHICKESRTVALSNGYRAWKVEGAEGATNMMWNPRIDFVFVSGAYAGDMSMRFLQRLFPTEARAITQLALDTSIFPKSSPDVRRRILRQWVTHVELKELVLVYDGVYERQCVQAAKDVFYETKGTSCPWSIPRDIEYTMKTLDKITPVIGEDRISRTKIPDIRVVDDEPGILSGERLELNLRCWPCRDVGMRETQMKGLGTTYDGRGWY